MVWMDNIKTSTGLPVEESIRMTKDRKNGESTSMEWPTLELRTTKEQIITTILESGDSDTETERDYIGRKLSVIAANHCTAKSTM